MASAGCQQFLSSRGVRSQQMPLIEYSNGGVYDGHLSLSGKRHGTGRYTWPNGDVYDGEWADGVQSGAGVKTYCNGDQYTGEWSDGLRHGKGRFITKSRIFKSVVQVDSVWANDRDTGTVCDMKDTLPKVQAGVFLSYEWIVVCVAT